MSRLSTEQLPTGIEGFFGRPGVWWLTLLAMCGLLLTPLMFADIPPVVDYPNHLARLVILGHAGEGSALDSIWRPHWAVIPDLGIDLVVPPLMHVMPPYAAGRLALALALLMPVGGAAAYSRAAFRRRLYWPMIAGLMAYNIIFVLGFLNYLISLGAALFAAAAWLGVRGQPWMVRLAVGALSAGGIFFIHIFGVAFFGILIGVAELDRLTREADGRTVRQVAHSAGLLAATFAPCMYLWTLVPPHLADTLVHRGAILTKLFFLAGPFIGYEALPGLLIGAALFSAAIWWKAKRRGSTGPGIPIAALTLAAAWLALPFAIGGGTFLDSRIPLMLALTLAAGIRPPAMNRRAARAIFVLAAAAFVLEIVPISVIWHRHEAQIADLRRTIAPVSPGSRVLVVSAPLDRDNPYWRASGALALGIFRTDYNLGALVAIDRQAFWPGLFADPSQQPVAIQPPYAGLAAPGWPPEIESLKLGQSTDPNWPAPYLKDWPANFDFVLVLNAGAIPDIARYLPERVTLIGATPIAALFQVNAPAR